MFGWKYYDPKKSGVMWKLVKQYLNDDNSNNKREIHQKKTHTFNMVWPIDLEYKNIESTMSRKRKHK